MPFSISFFLKNAFICIFLFAVSASWGANSISISGNPSTLTINSAVAGSQPTAATNNSTTYSVQTVIGSHVVLGSVNAALPSGVTLKVQLNAPPGATSLGLVTLTTTAQNLVTGITALTLVSNLTITYSLSATVSAAHVTNKTATVTLTVQ